MARACATCAGAGEIWEDAHTAARGHHTVHRPCPDCASTSDDDAARETAAEFREDR